MSWNFERYIKSQIGFFGRIGVFRKAIKSLGSELSSGEVDSIQESLHGIGWMADNDMQRIPGTDCISILVVTPARILVGAGALTTSILFHDISNCYWIDGDFCLKFSKQEAGLGGVRFETLGRKLPNQRCNALQQVVQQNLNGATHAAQKPSMSGQNDSDEFYALRDFLGSEKEVYVNRMVISFKIAFDCGDMAAIDFLRSDYSLEELEKIFSRLESWESGGVLSQHLKNPNIQPFKNTNRSQVSKADLLYEGN